MRYFLQGKVASTVSGLVLIALSAMLCALVPMPAYAHAGGETIVTANAQLLAGLIPADDECGPNGYLIEGTDLCSHGSDVPPSDEELEEAQLALDGVGSPVTTVCIGNGQDGKRVQVLYVRASDQADRYETSLKMIRTVANNVAFFFNASAHLTGGNRLLYLVTTPDCQTDVQAVEIPAEGDDSLAATVQALAALGYNSTDRKYLIFMDASVYCGIATVGRDTQPGPDNISNHRTGYARVDRNCWNELAATHELVHTMGGIQNDAPNSSGGWHCTDERDIMCYSDAPYYPTVRTVCTDVSYGQLLDCNNDDYFNTNPAVDSYLATHWNVADSQFLINFDNLAPDADITLTVTDTTSSDYKTMLNIAGGDALTELLDYVEFYADGQLLGTATGAEFAANWPAPAPGAHDVQARVYFLSGARVFQELHVTVPEAVVEAETIFLPLVRSN